AVALMKKALRARGVREVGDLLGASEAPGSAREPWQMTQQEWNEATQFRQGRGGRYAEFPTGERVQAPAAKLFDQRKEAFLKEWRRLAVKQAIEEGKPVPAKVLADYPELSKPSYRLESPTAEELAREKLKAIEDALAKGRREEIARRQAAPLTGSNADVGQGKLFAQDEDLFSGKSAETASRQRGAGSGQLLASEAPNRGQMDADRRAIEDLMAALDAGVPEAAGAFEKAQAEPGGMRTIGRPDLANPSTDEGGRIFINAVDEARKADTERESHDQWNAQAREMVEKDLLGVKRRLLEIAQDPSKNGLSNAVDVKAAQLIVADLARRAAKTRSPALWREAQILAWAYREAGTETARALGARRDPFRTPAERHREFLAKMILMPDPKLRADIEAAPSPAEKSREIDRLKGEFTSALKAKDLARAKRMNAEMEAIRAKLDKRQVLDQAGDARLKRIEAELAKMGVTLDDVFNGEAQVRLKGARMVQNMAASYDSRRQRAIRLIQDGRGLNDISKITRMPVEEIQKFHQEFIGKMMDRLMKLGDEALDPAKFDMQLLQAGEAPGSKKLSDEERRARAMEILRQMGLRPEGVPATVAFKKKISRPTKPKTAKGAPTVADISGPEYQYQFDIGDPVHVTQVARTIQAIDSNGFDMLREYWINSILSGPMTHVANIAGNAVNAALDMSLQRGMEALLNSALMKVGLGDKNAPQLGEFYWMMRGAMPGFIRARRQSAAVWDAETGMWENDVLNRQIEFKDFGKLDYIKASIPGEGGRVIRYPGRALMVEDEFFKSVLGQMQVNAEAYRIAKGEGLKGEALAKRIAGLVNLPGSEAWQRAVTKTRDLVFQSDYDETTWGGQVMKGVQSFRDKAPGAFYFIPFLRTLYNIFRIGIRKSPLGVMNMVGRLAKSGFYAIKDGKPVGQTYAQGEMISHLAEQILAYTAVALLLGVGEGDDDDDEKKFLITGTRPFDATKRGLSELQDRTGTGAYTIRIGGSQFSYGRYEPIATVLGTTIDLIRHYKQRGKMDGAEWTGSLLRAIMDQATNKTWTAGMSQILKTVQDPREGVNYAANFAASFVPNVIRQPLRNLDPWKRETSVEAAPKDLAGRFVEKVAQTAISNVAGKPKVNVWGEEMRRKGNVLARLLIPGENGPIAEISRVDRMLMRWNAEHPSKAYAPSSPSRRVDMGAKPYYMTDAELSHFRKQAGMLAATRLRVMPLNAQRPTEADIDQVKKTISEARHEVLTQMFPQRAAMKVAGKSLAEILK
ncbi:MAG: hypothetical protein ACOYMV_10385, partial [Verrucomicrobiia bacterium]